MKRRFVLAGATASLIAVAGCLRNGQGDEMEDLDNGGSADDQKNDSSTQSDDNDESETLDCDIRNRREQGKADAIETSVSNIDD